MADYNLIIIGGGPAGYRAALTAAKKKLKCVLIEPYSLGGCCLNEGCIPVKLLFQIAKTYRSGEMFGDCLKNVSCVPDWTAIVARIDRVVQKQQRRIDNLLRMSGVRVIRDLYSFCDPYTICNQSGETLTGDYYLIATGSRQNPAVGGISLRQWLLQAEMSSLVEIVGGGVIGCEWASILSTLGCRVRLIEQKSALLANWDTACVRIFQQQLCKNGVEVVFANTKKPTATTILNAAGRVANTEPLHLAAAGVECNSAGFVTVDAVGKTSNPRIFAAGDLCGMPFSQEKAVRQGNVVVDYIAAPDMDIYPDDFPEIRVVFGFPELASVGLSEEECQQQGIAYEVETIAIAGNGKTVVCGERDGLVKIICRADNQQLLGIHCAAPECSEWINSAAVALTAGWTIKQLRRMKFPHPTFSELFHE